MLKINLFELGKHNNITDHNIFTYLYVLTEKYHKLMTIQDNSLKSIYKQ